MGVIRKGVFFFATLVLLVTVLATPVYCHEIETTALSAVLMDGRSGEILFQKEPHVPRAPASMTKIMTLLLAFEAMEAGQISLQDQVLITESVNTLGVDPGTWVWLEPGEQWSLQELLIAIAVASANDACLAVAEHIAGTVDDFVARMNQRAGELGMENTHYRNPHGLSDDEHYMSAYDTALLSREVLKHPQLLELTSIYEYPEFRPEPRRLDLWNTNKLLVWYDGVDGLKTGWTEEAGYCLTSTAQRDGLRLICVVMGCPVANAHFSESMGLLQYGFANYASERVVYRGQILGLLPVKRGKEEKVELIAADDLYVTLPKGERDISTNIELFRQDLTAPVEAGYICGKVHVLGADRVIGKIPLVTGSNVQKGNPILSSWRLFNKWFQFGG